MSNSIDQQSPPLSVVLTHAQRRTLAEILPGLGDRMKLAEKSSRAVVFAYDEIKAIQQEATEAMLSAESGLKRNSLRHIVEATTKAIDGSKGIGAIPISERVYQFKIALIDSELTIWRRIQVKNCTLDKLHDHIQTAMGWTNSHLHQFEINQERYGDPQLLDDGFDDFHCVDSTVTRISQIVPEEGKRFRFLYEYDFGDGWIHEVVFEGCLRAEKGHRYPVCVDGARACPPEDVGGVWGYAEFLDAIADPQHEQHADYMEWAGAFDPDRFDAGTTTKAMRRGLMNWRQ